MTDRYSTLADRARKAAIAAGAWATVHADQADIDTANDAIAAVDELEQAARERANWRVSNYAERQARLSAEARVAELEAALRYYAKEQNYSAGYVRRDRGRRARSVLREQP